jgi:small-conductance mechanosensitive channel
MYTRHMRIFLLATLLILASVLIAACNTLAGQSPGPAGTLSSTETPTLAATQAETTTEPEGENIVNTPTPAPTATPGVISELVKDVVRASGMQSTSFLKLSVEDWLNLAISLLIILVSFLLLGHLLYLGLEKLARRTPSKFDNLFLKAISAQLRWFVSLLGLDYATTRLLFLPPTLKQLLHQIYFAGFVLLIVLILWKLVNILEVWYREKAEEQGDRERRETTLLLLQRVLRFFIVMVGVIAVLDRFGINVSALLTVLGIGGLALSLAAQDTLANMISGLIILTDQPFRVGDRIEIQGLNTWGDVAAIGMRSTRIRTRDNRMVIVPNSSISSNQVVNYTYPDPRYRVQIEIGVAYGVDLKEVREIITKAVRANENVLEDKPVDVLFLEFGDSAMILRVRWWITSYVDTRRVFDQVNEAIYLALEKGGVEMPPQTFAVEIKQEHGEAQKGSNG